MKHDRISLIERAAEVYDFGAALRARGATAPAAEPEPERVPDVPAEPQRSPRAPEPTAGRALRPDPIPPAAAPRRMAGPVAEIDRRGLANAGYIDPEAPVTGLAEEFRLLKRQLLAGIERRASMPDEKRRSILVTSTQPREGKTFCAINLALSLAGERELEVLLVDGDFTKPELLPMLGLEGGPGLVDALADPSLDPEDLVIRTDVPGLSLLPSGRKEHDVPELLASERTRQLLARLLAGNPKRLILFDSPPALMASPASVLAGHVGQVLVVVRADRTTEADLRETIGLLDGCDHVGLILNGAALSVSGRNFGAYHGGRLED